MQSRALFRKISANLAACAVFATGTCSAATAVSGEATSVSSAPTSFRSTSAEPLPAGSKPVERLWPSNTPLHGFIDLNAYHDTRGFTTLTTNLYFRFENGWEYFGFSNFDGRFREKEPAETLSFYSEQNVRYRPFQEAPWDLVMQWVLKSDAENDVLRAGLRLRINDMPYLDRLFRMASLRYSVTAFPLQLDFLENGYAGQIEHFYRWDVAPDKIQRRIYFSGFIDHNLSSGSAKTSVVVTEHQLGLRLFAGLHAVAELRYNGYVNDRPWGLGQGIEYFAPF